MTHQEVEQQLLQLQCPFTWNINPEYQLDKYKQKFSTKESFLPHIKFVNFLMQIHKKVFKLEFEEAQEILMKAEEIMHEIDNSRIIVAKHILDSTKAHFLMKKGDLDEVKEILKNINNIDDKKYLSLLYEFKAAAWTFCNDLTSTANIAIKFAKLAIEEDSEASTSHYLLGKNLRKLRRLVSVFNNPGDEEIYHFSRAFELEKNPQFGIFLGQAFKENGNYKQASEILNDINDMNVTKPNMRLRLALFFLQSGELEKSKKCLDFVESVRPDSSMFLHYKGLYLMKKKKYEEAAECFKKTSDANNYGADLGYAKCMRILGKRFDFPAYFLNMLKKYPEFEDHQRKEVLLHVAFSYFNIKRDLREAIKYFYQAFQIEAQEYSLENYHDPFNHKSINVYCFLDENVFKKVKSYNENNMIVIPEDILSANEKLKEICEEYLKSYRKRRQDPDKL